MSCADASAVSYAEGGRHHQAKLLVEVIHDDGENGKGDHKDIPLRAQTSV